MVLRIRLQSYHVTILHMHAIYSQTQNNTHTKMNLSTVKWAQWDKTQSRELLGLFICVCSSLCPIVVHNTAENRPDNFPSCPADNHHCSGDVYLRESVVHLSTTVWSSKQVHSLFAANCYKIIAFRFQCEHTIRNKSALQWFTLSEDSFEYTRILTLSYSDRLITSYLCCCTAGCKVYRTATLEWYRRHVTHHQQISTCWRRLFTMPNCRGP